MHDPVFSWIGKKKNAVFFYTKVWIILISMFFINRNKLTRHTRFWNWPHLITTEMKVNNQQMLNKIIKFFLYITLVEILNTVISFVRFSLPPIITSKLFLLFTYLLISSWTFVKTIFFLFSWNNFFLLFQLFWEKLN